MPTDLFGGISVAEKISETAAFTCNTCGGIFFKIDGSPGDPLKDSTMLNDYLIDTNWYRNQRPSWFEMKSPNPYSCRKCVKLLVEAGLSAYVGGNAQRFLTEQDWI
ncbi:MAG: hypothetical protein AAB897_03980 [Patescibacteria group bacterium]